MSNGTQSGPVMDGSDDATNAEKLSGLAEQVEHDHRGEGAETKADELKDRMAEADVDAEAPADTEG